MRQRETAQPSLPASNASLLHVGCTANWWPASVMFWVSIQAHLSAFSYVWSSFHPSWTPKKLSGSVTASEYSWPTTMLQLSKMPLPNALLVAFTLCSPQPTATQSVFCHGMNEYSIRYGLPAPLMLVVCVWYPQYAGWPVATGRGGDVPAVLRLHVGPGAAAEMVHKRVEVRLELLARVERAVRVGDLESARPLGAPVDEIHGGLDLNADRVGAGAPAVVDDVVGQ